MSWQRGKCSKDYANVVSSCRVTASTPEPLLYEGPLCVLGTWQRDWIQGWALGASKSTHINEKGRKMLCQTSERSKLGGQVERVGLHRQHPEALAGNHSQARLFRIWPRLKRAGLGHGGGTPHRN